MSNNIDIIIEDFCKENTNFNYIDIKKLMVNLLLNKDYDQHLYNKLFENDFKLIKGKFISKIEKIIPLKCFNKLFNTEFQSHIMINDFLSQNKIKSNIVNIIDFLGDDNIYAKHIILIWKKFQKNNILNINPNTISFIEIQFEGNYENYLYFIIPRITKLNEKQISIIFENTFINHEKETNDSITENSEDLLDEVNSNDGNDYVQILEFNINNLQSELQDMKDNIIPKLNKLEDNFNTINEIFNEHQTSTKNSFEILENRFNQVIKIIHN